MAFGLFSGPLYHIWEKFLGIDDRPFWKRSLARVPLAGFLVFLAVAFPFFGPLNGVVGAFTTTFSTYIIPMVAYNLVYSAEGIPRAAMVKETPLGLPLERVRLFNWAASATLLVVGVGMGGYFSLTRLLDEVGDFQLFAECYKC